MTPVLEVIASSLTDAISRKTNIREFHVGRAARSQFQVEGSVQASFVRALVNTLNQQP